METITTQTKQRVDFDLSNFEGDPQDTMARMYEDTLKDFNEGSIVPGKIIEIRKSDVLIDIGYKSEGLIPLDEFGANSALKEGDECEVLLEQLEDEEGMVILSKRRAEFQRNWDNIVGNYEEGRTIEGEIQGRVKGGLIVDVGVDAFLPGSQIDVFPIRNVDELIGKRFEFKVLKVNQDRRNIVVSRRELLEETRRQQKKALLTEIEVGQLRKGVIKNITDFGAFIDLNGMDGLLHITDMSWGRINHPSEMLSLGQELEVIILDVDLDKERISLGLKQKTENPWDGIEEKYAIGRRIRGKVVNLMPYGAFIELEQGVEGMVHVSELSWTKRIMKASDVLSVGDEVEAVVLSINKEDKKISLGIRQTEVNPWDNVHQKYPIGSRIKGQIRNFTSYGAFVQLEEGIDGMIHVSDMSWTRKINHPSAMLKRGDEAECVVLEVDPENKRISLGLKQAQDDPWAQISDTYKVGNRVKGKVSKVAPFGAFVELAEGIDGLVHISQISDEKIENVKNILSPRQGVEARVIKIDPVERRIGLSMKAADVSDEEFEMSEEMLEGLRPGEDLVDLAGAFEEVLSDQDEGTAEEWHPGDK